MLQNESRVLIADNSGAKEVLIIRVLGGSNKKSARIGDLAVGTIKKAKPSSGMKGKVVTILILATKYDFHRKDGTILKFSENYATIIKIEEKPFSPSKINIPLVRELWSLGYKKLFSMNPPEIC